MPLPNRLALYLTGLIALIGGLAPLYGNFDWQSTAGVVAGIAAVAVVVREWLVNWGKWEERTDLISAGVPGYGADPEPQEAEAPRS